MPFNVADYLTSLTDLKGKPAFSFLLHGTYDFDAGNQLRKALTKKGTREVGYFHCCGADYFLGYLQTGYLFSPYHPTETELK